jgi:hypothetical protein
MRFTASALVHSELIVTGRGRCNYSMFVILPREMISKQIRARITNAHQTGPCKTELPCPKQNRSRIVAKFRRDRAKFVLLTAYKTG